MRAIIEVEAPYFIEGQSALQVRITEPMSWFNWVNDMSGLATINIGHSEQKTDKIMLKSPKKIQAIHHQLEPGFYHATKNNTYIAVFDITKSDAAKAKIDFAKPDNIEIQAWTRVSLYGIQETYELETIWFPWRSQEAFEGVSNDNDGKTWATHKNSLT